MTWLSPFAIGPYFSVWRTWPSGSRSKHPKLRSVAETFSMVSSPNLTSAQLCKLFSWRFFGKLSQDLFATLLKQNKVWSRNFMRQWIDQFFRGTSSKAASSGINRYQTWIRSQWQHYPCLKRSKKAFHLGSTISQGQQDQWGKYQSHQRPRAKMALNGSLQRIELASTLSLCRYTSGYREPST